MARPETLDIIMRCLKHLDSTQLDQVQLRIDQVRRSQTLLQENADTSLFLRLPGELRNQIYKYAMRDYLDLYIDSIKFKLFERIPKPAFFRLCKQVNTECRRLIPKEPLKIKWGDSMDEEVCGFIRDMYLKRDRDEMKLDVLGSFDSEERAKEVMGESLGYFAGVLVAEKELGLRPRVWAKARVGVELREMGLASEVFEPKED